MPIQRYFLLTLLVLLCFPLFSQRIKVVDESQAPIEGVIISNGDNNLTTNLGGIVAFKQIDQASTFVFRHLSYHVLKLTYDELVSNNFSVTLKASSINLDEVVIGAKRWEERKSEVPAQVISIGKQDVAFINPQTSADLLAGTGEVFVQKSQMGGGSPMLRGFAANNVLIVVDGVRMNNAIFRSGNLQNVILIDPNTIEKADVVLGPGAVMYGSDALGGVMDFHTVSPMSEKQGLNAEALLRVSSANKERTGFTKLGFTKEKFAWTGTFLYSDFGDLKAGSKFSDKAPDFGKRATYVKRIGDSDVEVTNSDPTVQVGSAYSQWNTMQKFNFSPNDHWQFDYGFYLTSSSNVPRYDRLTETRDGILRFAEWYYGPQLWMMNRFGLQYAQKTNFSDKIRVLLSHQRIDEDRVDRKVNNTAIRRREEDVNVYGVNLDIVKRLSSKGTLYYGAELIYNTVSSKGEVEDIITHEKSPVISRYANRGNSMTSSAVYVNYKQPLMGNKMFLNAGIRYTWVNLFSDFSDKSLIELPYDEVAFSTGALSGALGLVWLPEKSWKWSLNLATGFRAPNIDDAGKFFDPGSDGLVVPNPDLKPVYTYSAEVSGSKLLFEKVRLESTAFYTYLVDAMVRRPFQVNGSDQMIYQDEEVSILALQNTGTAYVSGVSLKLNAELTSWLSFKSSISYAEGKDIENDDPLRHVPPMFGQASLQYKRKWLTIESVLRFSDGFTTDEISRSEWEDKPYLYSEQGALPWQAMDMRFKAAVSNHVTISGGVENILDKHYRPYASGISAAGRNFVLALRSKI
ncbi:TonB-dependent receptor [Limibacter armeniacum]|uniref:TonB-dependent receptor n=1 Tax=Limibacter armeniacum TaxID=466084 RepID=UPI002FE66C1E